MIDMARLHAVVVPQNTVCSVGPKHQYGMRSCCSATFQVPLTEPGHAWHRLYSDAYDLFWHQLPYLIADLSGQYSGYTATQPCLDTLLYQIEHINETVIALPAAMTVSKHAFPMCLPNQVLCFCTDLFGVSIWHLCACIIVAQNGIFRLWYGSSTTSVYAVCCAWVIQVWHSFHNSC